MEGHYKTNDAGHAVPIFREEARQRAPGTCTYTPRGGLRVAPDALRSRRNVQQEQKGLVGERLAASSGASRLGRAATPAIGSELPHDAISSSVAWPLTDVNRRRELWREIEFTAELETKPGMVS